MTRARLRVVDVRRAVAPSAGIVSVCVLLFASSPVDARPQKTGATSTSPTKTGDDARAFIEEIEPEGTEPSDGARRAPDGRTTRPSDADTGTTGDRARAPTRPPPAPTSALPSAPASMDSVVEVRALSMDGLRERFDAAQAARRAGDPGAHKRQLVLLDEGLTDLGLVGRPGMAQSEELALASLVEARLARAAGARDEASEAVARAVRIAPDSASVHLERVAHAVSDIDPVALVTSTRDLARAVVARPDTRVAAVLLALLVAMAAILAVALVAALVTLVRGFRALVFDIHHTLPAGIARWQIAAVVAVLLAAPVVVGVGPVVVAAVWLVVLGAYLAPRERAVYALVFVALAALPFMAVASARLAVSSESTLGESQRALLDVGLDDVREALRTRDPATLPIEGLAALAEDDLREGRISAAKDGFRAVLARANDSAAAHNNLGVVAAVEGNLELADLAFKDALARDNTLFAAHFNRSLVATRSGKATGGELAPDALIALDPVENERLRRLTYRGADEKLAQNRAFALAPLATASVLPALREDTDAARRAYAEVARLLFVDLDARAATVALAALLALFLAMGPVARRIKPSRPCTRCGAPSGMRYDGEAAKSGCCSACFHAFVKKDGTLDAQMRALKERQGVQWRRRSRLVARGAAFLLPGGGQYVAASPTIAVVGGTAVAALAVVAIFAPTLGLLWPSLVLPISSAWRFFVGGLALTLHAALFLDAARRTE